MSADRYESLPDAIRQALGIPAGEKATLRLISIPAGRPNNEKPAHTPRDWESLLTLMAAPRWVRIECCIRTWDSGKTWEIRLIPTEWVPIIPKGALVWNINDRIEVFDGDADESRFGCSPYGIIFGNATEYRAEKISELKQCPGYVLYQNEIDARIKEIQDTNFEAIARPL